MEVSYIFGKLNHYNLYQKSIKEYLEYFWLMIKAEASSKVRDD